MIEKKRLQLAEFNSSSMADIAFLLLVFFLVTTTISMDKGINLVLPPIGDQLEVPEKNITNVLIDKTGAVMLDDDIVVVKNIAKMVKRKIAERGYTPEGNQIMIFSVKTDSKTKYEDYLAVLDQLKIAGATKISIANPDF
jgi:biopolymer transport protein ExbD